MVNKMEKYYIPNADINELIKMSTKLESGKEFRANLDLDPQDKVIATYITKVVDNTPLIDVNKVRLRRAEFNGTISGFGTTSNFQGQIYVDSFKDKKHFQLKRNIVQFLNNIARNYHLHQFNQGKVIYEADNLGRVYIYGEQNKKYYLSSSLKLCRDELGRTYELIRVDGSIYIEELPDYNGYFDYYYLTINDAKNAQKEANSKPILASKVIDIRPYIKRNPKL